MRRGGCDPLPRDDSESNTSDWSESNRKMSQVCIFFVETSEEAFQRKNRMDNWPHWSETRPHR